MRSFILANDVLTVSVSDAGAELRSVKENATGYEYMWQADPAYWGRTSPVLFPVVGSYRDKISYYEGEAYTLGQHGFARDSEFRLLSQSSTELWFALRDTAATWKVYPFRFMLAVGYRLSGRTITVSFHVHNRDSRRIYFSLGAHPAFNCSLEKDRLLFDTNSPLTSGILGPNGTLSPRQKVLPLAEGVLPLTPALFDEDALILEYGQTHRVSLYKGEGSRLAEVAFDAPLVGIWSPKGRNAPFVCIEPWYGRSDREDFNQKIEEREWGNTLAAGEDFIRSYTITAGEDGVRA